MRNHIDELVTLTARSPDANPGVRRFHRAKQRALKQNQRETSHGTTI
jgi:hypothetical protein